MPTVIHKEVQLGCIYFNSIVLKHILKPGVVLKYILKADVAVLFTGIVYTE